MQGLLLRLSALDSDAESAVRLISFFDALIEQRASVEVLLRQSAAVAERAVGIQDEDGRFATRATPDGATDGQRSTPDALTRKVAGGYQVWISSGDTGGHPSDQILLERLGIAFLAGRRHDESTVPAFGDPALLEMIVSRTTGVPERSRALHLLGMTPATSLTFLAALGPAAEVAAIAAALHSCTPRLYRARIGGIDAFAVMGPPPATITVQPGVTIGVGSTTFGVDAATSWDKAVRALRFATPAGTRGDFAARPVIRADDLGAFELLAAQLRSPDIRGIRDVDVLDELAAEAPGAGVIRTLEIVVESASLREAARKLYLHHNSVSARLERVEDRLGYRINEPNGIARLGLALALRRLRTTDLLG